MNFVSCSSQTKMFLFVFLKRGVAGQEDFRSGGIFDPDLKEGKFIVKTSISSDEILKLGQKEIQIGWKKVFFC